LFCQEGRRRRIRRNPAFYDVSYINFGAGALEPLFVIQITPLLSVEEGPNYATIKGGVESRDWI
jgi:hypothetical protein